jgi:putative flippase GtrA
MLTGVVLAVVALAVFINPVRAWVAAIIATCLAIVVSFLWMPYYPVRLKRPDRPRRVAVWGVTT